MLRCTCLGPGRKGGSSNRGWQELVLAKLRSLESPQPFFQLYSRLEHVRRKNMAGRQEAAGLCAPLALLGALSLACPPLFLPSSD